MNYSSLYFDGLAIADVLTTIGVKVKVGGTEISWAHDVGDFGGEPETLDATPLSSTVKLNKSGLQSQDSWTIDYYYNDTDYATLNAKVNVASTAIEVVMNNGTKFTNTGTVTANYVSGMGVNAMADAHCTIDLDGAWTRTTS